MSENDWENNLQFKQLLSECDRIASALEKIASALEKMDRENSGGPFI